MNAPTNGNLAGDLARQVKRARELIAELDRPGSGWNKDRDALGQWIGRLESRLELLCDAVDYQLAGTR